MTTILNTNWFAIAGSVSSGKTTLVDMLSDYYGFRKVPDHARAVIEEALSTGLTHNDIVTNRQFYQDQIAERYVNACCALEPSEFVIHDYGMPCVKSWYTVHHLDPRDELNTACKTFRYRTVFLVSPLQIVDDGIRITTDMQHNVYHEMVTTYRELGYKIIHVPAFYRDRDKSVQARFDFVKDHMDRIIAKSKKSATAEREEAYA